MYEYPNDKFRISNGICSLVRNKLNSLFFGETEKRLRNFLNNCPAIKGKPSKSPKSKISITPPGFKNLIAFLIAPFWLEIMESEYENMITSKEV